MNDVFLRLRPLVLELVLATALLGVGCGTASTSDKNVTAQGGGAGTPAVADPDWCAARRVLEAKCWRCHADPPEHGAPFALVSYDDTQAVDAKGRPRFAAIERAVDADAMPALFVKLDPPVEPLSDTEKQVLLDWCRAGAPAAPDASCDAAH